MCRYKIKGRVYILEEGSKAESINGLAEWANNWEMIFSANKYEVLMERTETCTSS